MKVVLLLFGCALAAASPHKVVHMMPTVDVINGVVDLKKESKIVNGQEATPHEFPWQVKLLIDDMYFCGGSLISFNTVLTAAHCTTGAKTIVITAGAHDQTAFEITQQDITVTSAGGEILTHPDYASATLHNDLGMLLIKRSTRFTQTDAVDIITLPPYGAAPLGAGETVIVSGWGKTNDGVLGSVHDTLQKTTDLTISNDLCAETYGKITIDDGTMCTDTHSTVQDPGVHGTCNGDSGGPLMWDDQGVRYHRGITSFVASVGCESGEPDGFTRTESYIAWITNNMV